MYFLLALVNIGIGFIELYLIFFKGFVNNFHRI